MAEYWLLGFAGLALAGLYLFVRLKREMAAFRAERDRRLAALESALAALRANLDEVEERAGVLAPPVPPRSGFNISTRAQALRMFRRGEPPHEIAAALRVPVTEIRLLLKVHELTEPRRAPPGGK